MIDNWIVNNYDRIVRGAGGDGIKVRDARTAVVERIVCALETGEVEPLNAQRMAEAMADQAMLPARRARKTALHDQLNWIIEDLHGETVLGHAHPRLRQAFALGDGRDKTLALWSVDDWRGALNVRREKRDEFTAAVQIFEDQVQTVVAAMFAAGATTTADLFPDSDAGAA